MQGPGFVADFGADIRAACGAQRLRLLAVVISRASVGIGVYRLERFLYQRFGTRYRYLRVVALPFLHLLGAYSNIEIHYQASIGPGLRVLHPALGLVINGACTIGDRAIFAGGNCVGIYGTSETPFVVGDNLEVGANATIIGPLVLGDRVRVGAGACVTQGFDGDDLVLTGVPARAQLRDRCSQPPAGTSTPDPSADPSASPGPDPSADPSASPGPNVGLVPDEN